MALVTTFSNPALRQRGLAEVLTAAKTFDISDSGKVFLIATDSLIMTLPLITAENLGLTLTIVNSGADGNNIITIAPNAADAFNGGLVTSTGLNADATTSEALMGWANGTVDKDYINTKTTANKGDFVVIVAIALTHWQIIGGAGTWISE